MLPGGGQLRASYRRASSSKDLPAGSRNEVEPCQNGDETSPPKEAISSTDDIRNGLPEITQTPTPPWTPNNQSTKEDSSVQSRMLAIKRSFRRVYSSNKLSAKWQSIRRGKPNSRRANAMRGLPEAENMHTWLQTNGTREGNSQKVVHFEIHRGSW